MEKRVIVAMSGGVDSSVAAALLKKQGFEIIGVFMRLWSPKTLNGTNKNTNFHEIENKCCNIESLEGARRVAAKLEIPFYTIDLVKEFRKYVVDYYIKEYSRCLTPNPCVICNKFIKFDLLLSKAFALGADYLATGHYVRIAHDLKSQISNLKSAKDKIKDQSYFLWTLTQEQLPHLLFPIGDYTKKEVREMARKWKLPTAFRAESQGLCFIGYWDNREFLEKFIKPRPGPIKDLKGNILGKHRGLPFYTVGQRKRLEIEVKTPETPPLYVIKLDAKNNTLIIGEEKNLYQKELEVKDVNWIDGQRVRDLSKRKSFKCGARIRYGHPIVKSKIKSQKSKIKVEFEKPVRAITPGQSIVFYDKEEVLGGGIIKS